MSYDDIQRLIRGILIGQLHELPENAVGPLADFFGKYRPPGPRNKKKLLDIFTNILASPKREELRKLFAERTDLMDEIGDKRFLHMQRPQQVAFAQKALHRLRQLKSEPR